MINNNINNNINVVYYNNNNNNNVIALRHLRPNVSSEDARGGDGCCGSVGGRELCAATAPGRHPGVPTSGGWEGGAPNRKLGTPITFGFMVGR